MLSYPSIYRWRLYEIIDRDGLPENWSLHAFKNVQQLSMDIDSFDRLSPGNKAIWSNNESLQRLHLMFDTGPITQDAIYSLLKHQHLISHVNVRTVQFDNFAWNHMLDVMFNFPNVENLELEDIGIGESETTLTPKTMSFVVCVLLVF